MNNTAVKPQIAVIASDTLTGVGLRAILEKIIPFAAVRLFGSYAEFAADGHDGFAHCFVDAATFAAYADFFADPARSSRTIVLTGSEPPRGAECSAHINICSSEEQIVREILRLHGRGHAHGHPSYQSGNASDIQSPLSQREGEVLALVARGMLNKQIADRMEISLTTVISHRRNITRKLGIKSVAELTIYAVTHGYADSQSV